MSALLIHDTFLEHNNLVSVADSRQAMGNDANSLRASLDKRVQGHLHLMLTLSIKGRCGLVEKDDFRATHEGSSDGDALLLAARKAHTTLADKRVEALREEQLVLDEGQGVRHFARLAQPFVDFVFGSISEIDTIEDVVFDAA